jgi:hypothetical protein
LTLGGHGSAEKDVEEDVAGHDEEGVAENIERDVEDVAEFR